MNTKTKRDIPTTLAKALTSIIKGIAKFFKTVFIELLGENTKEPKYAYKCKICKQWKKTQSPYNLICPKCYKKLE